jgi:hypothetical protein
MRCRSRGPAASPDSQDTRGSCAVTPPETPFFPRFSPFSISRPELQRIVPETKAALDLRPILISAHQPIREYVTSISSAMKQWRGLRQRHKHWVDDVSCRCAEVIDGQTEVIVHCSAVRKSDASPDEWEVEPGLWASGYLTDLSGYLRVRSSDRSRIQTDLATAGKRPL